MTSLGMAAAAAVLLAGVGMGDVATGPAADPGIGTAQIIQVKHGYFRRDLGLDPAYSNFRQNSDQTQGQKKGTRGFRLDGAPHHGEIGIQFFYDGGHSYIGHSNGLRLDHADPGLLEK